MPPVVKRTLMSKPSAPKTKPKIKLSASSSLLDRIGDVMQVDSGGLKVSLYGRAKTGKTRLISTFPKPVLIIGPEDGTRSIRTVEGVRFVRVILRGVDPPDDGRFIYLDEFSDFVEEVKGSGEYASVAVDTASALQDLILAEILGLTELPAQSSWGMATQQEYGQCSLQLKTLLRMVLNLPQHVVITAHERNFNDDNSGGSELLTPTVGSALSPSVAGWLNGACEYICQSFIRNKEKVTVTTVGKGPNAKKVKMKTKTDEAEYCLRVGPHPVYTTGFRLPPGFTLPDMITDPSYDKIQEVVQGQFKSEK